MDEFNKRFHKAEERINDVEELPKWLRETQKHWEGQSVIGVPDKELREIEVEVMLEEIGWKIPIADEGSQATDSRNLTNTKQGKKKPIPWYLIVNL